MDAMRRPTVDAMAVVVDERSAMLEAIPDPRVNTGRTIRMLTLSHDIVLPLDRFAFVHNSAKTGMVGK
jgi:hypothetical protein